MYNVTIIITVAQLCIAYVHMNVVVAIDNTSKLVMECNIIRIRIYMLCNNNNYIVISTAPKSLETKRVTTKGLVNHNISIQYSSCQNMD